MSSRGQKKFSRYGNIKAKQFSPSALMARKEDLALIRATERAEASRAARAMVNQGPLLGLMRRQALQSGRGPEIKFVDSQAVLGITGRLAATPPVAVSLFTPVQGAAGFNRIGQKVTLKSLRVRGFVLNLATAVQGTGRIIIVYDKQANAALPNWADLITSISAAGAATTGAMDGINMANRERFIVLADEQFWLPSVTNTAGVLTNVGGLNTSDKNPSMFNFDRFIKLRDMETHFNNTNGGTFADIQTGSLNMFFVLTGTDQGYQGQFVCRTRFADS